MITIQEVIDGVTALNTTLIAGFADIKSGLDRIATLVSGLEGGQVATQEQIDALKAAVDTTLSTTTTALGSISTQEGLIK